MVLICFFCLTHFRACVSFTEVDSAFDVESEAVGSNAGLLLAAGPGED